MPPTNETQEELRVEWVATEKFVVTGLIGPRSFQNVFAVVWLESLQAPI